MTSTKVTVVVPVYNPGSAIDGCIESLRAQTLDPNEFEAVFVDDGSTDGTSARLDRLAQDHSHFRVIHIPNSGWPGKPRNVGTEAARGEYVQYVDQDDFLGPDALRRLYELGSRNGSDIVIGKVVSNFRGVPTGLWKTTRNRCSIHDYPLWDSVTPHKMFRKAFLDKQEIRFPEGKRRLEDQVFMMEAYFCAETVSILGEYTCYYYWRREDELNAGSTPIDPVGYYANLREVLDVIERHTEPGPFRNMILQRFYRIEMLGRLNDAPLLSYPSEYRSVLFDEIRRLALERIPEGVQDLLSPLLRLRSALLREGSLDALTAFAQRCHEVWPACRLKKVEWRSGVLRLVYVTELWCNSDGQRPLRLARFGDRYVLDPALSEGLLDCRIGEVSKEHTKARAHLSLRNRQTAEEWVVPAHHEVLLDDERGQAASAGDGDTSLPVRVRVRTVAKVDPMTLAGGEDLARGLWDMQVRVTMFGFDRRVRLGDGRGHDALPEMFPALLGSPARVLVPFVTDDGNVGLDVDRHVRTLGRALRGRRGSPRPRHDGRLVLTVPVVSLPDTEPVGCEVVLRRGGRSGGESHAFPGWLRPTDDGRTRLVFQIDDSSGRTRLRRGRWQVLGRLDGGPLPEVPLATAVVHVGGRVQLVAGRADGAGQLSRDSRARVVAHSVARRARRSMSRARVPYRLARKAVRRVRWAGGRHPAARPAARGGAGRRGRAA